MRTLILWDDPEQAELISLYLNVDDGVAHVTCDAVEFDRFASGDDPFDVILLPTEMPNHEEAYRRFERVREQRPDCPVVGACSTDGVFKLATFITNGMRSYVLRDAGGDFVFLLSSTLRSTVDAVRAERERVTAAKMRAEIESVRRFQEAIIPTNLAVGGGYELEGRYEPSAIRTEHGKPVALAGGDYYEVIEIDNRTSVLLMGDAAGHGMRACMSIMAMYTVIRMLTDKTMRRPDRFLAEINRRFCEHAVFARDGTMLTFFVGVLRVDRHEMTWASAGHPLPIVQSGADAFSALGDLKDVGPPIGFDDEFRYTSATARIPPGSRILIFTDGLPEAYPPEDVRQQFGDAGIRRTLEGTWSRTAGETLDALLDDSHDWTGGAGRHDDTSLLLLTRPDR